jgi:signal transduction histidine kinase
MSTERRTHGPRRFRRRLTAAFVLVAAISAGLLAVLTYGATSNYRWRNFESSAHDEVRLALALAPSALNEESFERLLAAYEKRAGTETVAFTGERAYSTSMALTEKDVPSSLFAREPGELATTHVSRDGGRYLVVGTTGPAGARYAFYFSLEQLQASLAELRVVLLAGWVAVVVAAAAAGQLVARRTLRPVKEAADAAAALAAGLLDTRLASAGKDEFGVWAESFNSMADALEAKIDQLARAAERERQFTSDVAHDLRTPLTGIAATAMLLDDQLDELPASARRAMSILVNDVTRLRDLVLELLELSRLDAGTETIQTEDFSVDVALRATVDALKLAPEVGVEVEAPAGLMVAAERARFRRVVSNLVVNAATHGGGRVHINARPRRATVEIDVRDDGPGVDPAKADRIFDRFYKSDESRAHGGSGLGLAIAREHARAQGGDVTLVEDTGRGACFRIVLPAPAPDVTAPTPQRAESRS